MGASRLRVKKPVTVATAPLGISISENNFCLIIWAVRPVLRVQNIACDTEFNLAQETFGIGKVFQTFIDKAEIEN